MERIKIAQYGVTHEHASGKIGTLRKMSDLYDIVGVVDDRESSQAARWPWTTNMAPYEGLTRLTPEELLNYPGLQAVTVEVTNDELVPVAMKCLEHNLPIHLDKPGGQTLEPYVSLSKGYEAKNLPLQMGYMFRCNPAVQYAVNFVKKGLLGEVFFIEADMNHAYGDEAYQDYLGTFQGGILYNLCCHHLDYITEMMGRPTKVTHFPGTVPGTKGTPENLSLAVLEYGACRCILRASSKEDLYKRILTVSGTKGSITIQPVERFDGKPLTLSLKLYEPAGDLPAGEHTLNFGVQTDRYCGQFKTLADILRGNIPNPQLYAHDRLVQEVLLEMCR